MSAAVVARLAVLLSAGVEPLAAWRALGRTSGTSAGADAAVVAAVTRATAADEIPDRLAAGAGGDPAWRCVAAAWRVAAEAGSPLAPTLRRVADVLRDIDATAREVAAALAGPRAGARLMAGLPLLGAAVGILLGFDPVGAATGSPLGAGSVIAGIVLLLAGRRWIARLVADAGEHDPVPGLAFDLIAIGLAGGAGADAAVARCRAALAGWPDAVLADEFTAAEAMLGFAVSAGVPAAELLRAGAEERRATVRAAARRRAAELGTRLLLPLGVCLLPSFAALAVVPVVLAIVSSTAGVG